MDLSELVKILGIGGTFAFVVIVLFFRFGNAKIDLWKRRENKSLDNFETTIAALNNEKLTTKQLLDLALEDRDRYKKSWEDAAKLVEAKNATMAANDEASIKAVNDLK